MNVVSLSIDEFELSWQSTPKHRYNYELNNGALVLFGSLFGAFWTYWSITVSGSQLDWVLATLASVFAVVTVYVVYNILRWRHFGRKSGAICEENRLVWRHGSIICAASWKDLDLDAIGLLDTSLGEHKYEHHLTIDGKLLYLFRPFVRMRRYEGFIADVLIRLKDHGRIPETKGKKRRKKKQ